MVWVDAGVLPEVFVPWVHARDSSAPSHRPQTARSRRPQTAEATQLPVMSRSFSGDRLATYSKTKRCLNSLVGVAEGKHSLIKKLSYKTNRGPADLDFAPNPENSGLKKPKSVHNAPALCSPFEADVGRTSSKFNTHHTGNGDAMDWKTEARGKIQHLIHEGILHICSKMTLEYEVENVELCHERYKHSHVYDEQLKRFEYNFRLGLEQAAASVVLPENFSAKDQSLPISKWCRFVCKKSGKRGAFELCLVVDNWGESSRRVPVYSTLRTGIYPDAKEVMEFLGGVVPRVQAAYPTPAQALDNATFMGNAPSSALQVIVRAFSAADRDQSQAVNAMRIFELREKEREEVRRSTILKRALNRMLRQAITETFEAWADLVKNEGGKRNVMTRILLRMTNKCVSGAFERWVENMVEHQTLRAKSNRVLVRWKNQSCAMCLDAWTSHTKEEIHKRNRMKQMLMKMFKREMSSAFENWVARMEEIKEAQAEEQRKQECMKRIAMRMVNMGLVMCLEAWAEYTAEESRKRALLKRMVLRMTGSILNRMFEQWKEVLEDLRREEEEEERRQQVLQRVAARMLNKTLSIAFMQWCEHVDELKIERDKSNLQQALEEQWGKEKEAERLALEAQMRQKAADAANAQARVAEMEEEMEREANLRKTEMYRNDEARGADQKDAAHARARAAELQAELERERTRLDLAQRELAEKEAKMGEKEESKACVIS